MCIRDRSQLVRMTGQPNILMVTGTVMLGGIARGAEFSATLPPIVQAPWLLSLIHI